VLRNAGVRYLVAGGVAVNAHGYLRLTYDVDLVIQLAPDNIQLAFNALAALGYRPTVPVTAEQFSDEAQRARWIRENGMQVLNFHSDLHRPFTVDVFVSVPFDFEREYGAALQGELAPGLIVRFVSIPELIEMRELANRPRDLDGIEHLRMILEGQRRSERTVDAGWETATWEGSRRFQLRSALALTVRERMQALESLVELAQRLAKMPRSQGVSAEE